MDHHHHHRHVGFHPTTLVTAQQLGSPLRGQLLRCTARPRTPPPYSSPQINALDALDTLDTLDADHEDDGDYVSGHTGDEDDEEEEEDDYVPGDEKEPTYSAAIAPSGSASEACNLAALVAFGDSGLLRGYRSGLPDTSVGASVPFAGIAERAPPPHLEATAPRAEAFNIDRVTLECMMNKSMYKKYLAKTDQDKYQEMQAYSRRLASVREPVLDLTRQLIDDYVKYSKSQKYTQAIHAAFESYMDLCITYVQEHPPGSENEDIDVLFDPRRMQPSGSSEVKTGARSGTQLRGRFWGR